MNRYVHTVVTEEGNAENMHVKNEPKTRNRYGKR